MIKGYRNLTGFRQWVVHYHIMYPSGYLLKDEFGSYAFTAEDYIKVLKLGMKLGQLGYNDITVKNIKERYDM